MTVNMGWDLITVLPSACGLREAFKVRDRLDKLRACDNSPSN